MVMPYPDNFSTAKYNAAQGRDDTIDDRAEYAAVTGALTALHPLSELLQGIETTDASFNCVCWELGEDIEDTIAKLRRMMP